jgi:hypothetical protein
MQRSLTAALIKPPAARQTPISRIRTKETDSTNIHRTQTKLKPYGTTST